MGKEEARSIDDVFDLETHAAFLVEVLIVRSPAPRSRRSFEGSGNFGTYPSAIKITFLRDDFFVAYPALIDPGSVEGDAASDGLKVW